MWYKFKVFVPLVQLWYKYNINKPILSINKHVFYGNKKPL